MLGCKPALDIIEQIDIAVINKSMLEANSLLKSSVIKKTDKNCRDIPSPYVESSNTLRFKLCLY